MPKIITFLTLLLLFAMPACPSNKPNILTLTKQNFPSILQKHTYVMIEFYAPWCDNCEVYEPMYREVAGYFGQQKGKVDGIRFGRINAKENSEVSNLYGVHTMPTYMLFINGHKLDYRIPKSANLMINWLLRQTKGYLESISQQRYQSLLHTNTIEKSQYLKAKANQKYLAPSPAHIIYHGDLNLPQNRHVLDRLTELSKSDYFNRYYWSAELGSDGRDGGALELVRSFGQNVIHMGDIDAGIREWIQAYDRPLVRPFDQRIIRQIFSQNKKVAILLNPTSSNTLSHTFSQSAQHHQSHSKQPLIYTQLRGESEHMVGFPRHLRVDVNRFNIVVVDHGRKLKFVYGGKMEKEGIAEFFTRYEAEGGFGFNDEVGDGDFEEL